MLRELCGLRLTVFQRNTFVILHMDLVLFETSGLSFKNLLFKFKRSIYIKPCDTAGTVGHQSVVLSFFLGLVVSLVVLLSHKKVNESLSNSPAAGNASK